jgi:hypothetical protein
MGADDRTGTKPNRFPENFSWVNEAIAGRSRSRFANAQQTVLPIEAKRPKLFDSESNRSRSHVFEYSFRIIENRKILFLAGKNASTDFNDNYELKSFNFSDTFEFHELAIAPVDQLG